MPDYKSISEYQSPSLTPTFERERAAFRALENQKKGLLEAAQKEARRILLSAGFAEDQVQMKIQRLEKGIARDIIKMADADFDVLVLGKRGVSASSAFFLGSVSQKVLHGLKTASVLVVS